MFFIYYNDANLLNKFELLAIYKLKVSKNWSIRFEDLQRQKKSEAPCGHLACQIVIFSAAMIPSDGSYCFSSPALSTLKSVSVKLPSFS